MVVYLEVHLLFSMTVCRIFLLLQTFACASRSLKLEINDLKLNRSDVVARKLAELFIKKLNMSSLESIP